MPSDRSKRGRDLGVTADARTDARERSMLLLYEAHSKRLPVADVVDAQVVRPDELTRTLALGVEEHRRAGPARPGHGLLGGSSHGGRSGLSDG